LLIRGIFAVLFGILASALSGPTLVKLVLLYGFYALAGGRTTLWAGAGSRARSYVLVGELGIIAGIITIIYPGITAIVLLY
jgi:uncharacterized membrane protein HdeD (DUF308 family)